MAASNLTLQRAFALLLAAGTLGNAIYGLRTGDIAFFRSRANRSADPILFWLAVLLSAILTVALLVWVITGHLD